jgi:hypothetical protein
MVLSALERGMASRIMMSPTTAAERAMLLIIVLLSETPKSGMRMIPAITTLMMKMVPPRVYNQVWRWLRNTVSCGSGSVAMTVFLSV